jgi:LacI family transcriptional regulator
MKIITIKDIAQMLNVSPSTISRALKDHPDIGAELKEKIRALARELKYTPNTIATNLRNQKSQLIGVVIPKFFSNFVPDVIDGISAVIDQQAYQMIIIPTNDELEKEKQAIQKCCDYRVDGILLSLSTETEDLEHLSLVKDYNIPLVLFDKAKPSPDFHQVTIDDVSMAHDCGIYLKEQECKYVAGFFGHENLAITQHRHRGFLSAFAEDDTETRCFFASNSEEAYEQTAALLQKQPIDGIFGMSDEVLLGMLKAVIEQNLLDSIHIIGFSDGKTIPYLHREVAYVLHSGRQIGTKAANVLFDIIQGRQLPETNIRLQSAVTPARK